MLQEGHYVNHIQQIKCNNFMEGNLLFLCISLLMNCKNYSDTIDKSSVIKYHQLLSKVKNELMGGHISTN